MAGYVCRRGFGSGPDYKCINVADCESFEENIKNEQYFDFCSFGEIHPIFCCPTDKNANVAIALNSHFDDNENPNSAIGSTYT